MKIKERSKKIILIKIKNVKSDNFRGSNREKYNIAIAILEKRG